MFIRSVSIQLTSARTFTVAPYHWKIHSLGLFSISGFIGALISFFVGGWLIDFIANRQVARRQHAEPEFRLPGMIIPVIIGPTGVLTFGMTIAYHKPWISAAVGFAMSGFGLTAVSNVVVTYAVDAYRPVSFVTLYALILLFRKQANLIYLSDLWRSPSYRLYNPKCDGGHSLPLYSGLDCG